MSVAAVLKNMCQRARTSHGMGFHKLKGLRFSGCTTLRWPSFNHNFDDDDYNDRIVRHQNVHACRARDKALDIDVALVVVCRRRRRRMRCYDLRARVPTERMVIGLNWILFACIFTCYYTSVICCNQNRVLSFSLSVCVFVDIFNSAWVRKILRRSASGSTL